MNEFQRRWAWLCGPLVVFVLSPFVAGCGESKLDEMRRRAIRRPAEDAVEPTKPPAVAEKAKTKRNGATPQSPTRKLPPPSAISKPAQKPATGEPPPASPSRPRGDEAPPTEESVTKRAAPPDRANHAPPAFGAARVAPRRDNPFGTSTLPPREASTRPDQPGSSRRVAAAQPPPDKPPVEAAAAELLHQGRPGDALRLHYARLIQGEFRSVEETGYGWCPALKQPMIAVRWGVVFGYTGPRELARKMSPIQPPNGSGRPRFDFKIPAELQTSTGELAQRVLAGLYERAESGAWGRVVQSALEQKRGRRIAPSRRASGDPQDRLEQVFPSTVYIPYSGAEHQLYLAKNGGLDVAVLFEIDVRLTREKQVLNNTVVKVIDIATEETLYEADALNNIRVAIERRNPTGKDPVSAELEKLFAFLDENLRLTDMPPTLKPEHAAGRVQTLMQAEHENPLPALSEIRMYRVGGWLTDGQLFAAYKAILGDEAGGRLFTGSKEEKEAILKPYLPEIVMNDFGRTARRSDDD